MKVNFVDTPLPCSHWCLICPQIQKDLETDDSCENCPDCNINVAAADDAT